MKHLLATALVCLAPLLCDAAPFIEKSDVFPKNLNGVNLYRIPGIVVTPKGTVLAYCEARKTNGGDWGEIEVHLRRSLDGGKTWDTPQKIAHSGERIEGNPTKPDGGANEQTVNNPVAIVDTQSGAITFLYCINYARCFSMQSVDEGLTWSAPVELTTAFEPFRSKVDWKVIATGPGHGIQTTKGRMIVPVWLAYGKAGAHHPSIAATIFSDDRGKTWHAGDVAFPNEGEFGDPNETTLAELSDGSVMLVSRNVSASNRKLVSVSADGAHHWSTPRFHPELWEPVCMAGLLRIPSEGGLLLFSCPRNLALDPNGAEIPRKGAKRRNLAIGLSRDEGKTWPTFKTLEQGPSGYSDLAALKDGTVVCFYEGTGGTLQAARFNIEWLTASDASQ